jgi:small subunit ribosomal protein S2
MALPDFNMRQLLEAGAHFGHQTHRWNPKMDRFIFGSRANIHIIDLSQSLPLLHQALVKVREVAAGGGRVLFVGTKRQASEPVSIAAKRCAQYYVNHRWLGGTLTNWRTISASIARLRELEGVLEGGEGGRTKKELLTLTRERDKLELSLGGIKNMGGIPDLMFVIDTNKEAIAIQEARKLNIPVIAILDTNSDPDGITYPIPATTTPPRASSSTATWWRTRCWTAWRPASRPRAWTSARPRTPPNRLWRGDDGERAEVAGSSGHGRGGLRDRRRRDRAPAGVSLSSAEHTHSTGLEIPPAPPPESTGGQAMAEITAALVKDLREKSGAGMMDCKKALTENSGDVEAAMDWLRTKGLSKAAKKADRVAAEGLVAVALRDEGAGMIGAAVEVNAETDFVARNEKFQNAARQAAQAALGVEGGVDQLAQAKTEGGETVSDVLTGLIATIGENMVARRMARFQVSQGVVAAYTHNAVSPGLGKIGVLVAWKAPATRRL